MHVCIYKDLHFVNKGNVNKYQLHVLWMCLWSSYESFDPYTYAINLISTNNIHS